MRYIGIFGITIILVLLILFYDPYKKYLGVYNYELNIELNNYDKDYTWIYDKDNENLKINNISSNKWNFKILNDGITNIYFYYLNEETNDIKYKIHYEFKIKNDKIYWISGQGNGLLDFPNPF